MLTFASGAICTAQMSFDVWDSSLPFVEMYGSEGTLALTNPNYFDGDVRIRRHGDDDWQVLTPVTALFGQPGTPQQRERGLGVRDLVGAIDGDVLRVDPVFAYHVLDVLLSIGEAADRGERIDIAFTAARPAPLVS